MFKRIRQWLGLGVESNEVWIEPSAPACALITGYFDRLTDKAQLREAIKKRYSTSIAVVKDETTGQEIEVYRRGEFGAAVDAGLIEIITIGWGHNIVAALASLFIEKTQKFSLVPSREGVDTTKALKALDAARGPGGFLRQLSIADKRAVQIRSSILLVEWVDDHLRYRVFDPGKVKIRYDSFVQSNDEPRRVDMTDLEDATCVILETGTLDAAGTERSYLAIFGRSAKYPDGRYVTYSSAGDGKDVPEPGTEGTIDYPLGNPLSVYANQNPDAVVPEYPLAIFYGDDPGGYLLPVSTSLLEDSIEADIAASHVRGTGQDASRGTNLISRDKTARAHPLPRSLRGDVAIPDGMTFEHVSLEPEGPKTLWETTKNQGVVSAQSWGVPDYMAVPEDHTLEASSGIALQVKTRPLIKKRHDREALNAPSVHKVFEVERAYLDFFSASLAAGVLATLKQCDQQWEAGELILPRDEKETVEVVNTLVEKGTYDEIERIRVIYQLASEQDAIEKYRELQVRRKKYPPLTEGDTPPPQARGFGLLRRRGGQSPGQPPVNDENNPR